MQPNNAGRFCNSCMKSVIDFSGQTDEQIKTYIRAHRDEAICGRFYSHQVDRIRIEIDEQLLYSSIPFWQKFLVVVLICFGNDVLGYDFVFAQTDSIPVPVEQLDSIFPVTTEVTEIDSALTIEIDTFIPKLKGIETTICTAVPDLMVFGSVMIVEEPLTNPGECIDFIPDIRKTDNGLAVHPEDTNSQNELPKNALLIAAETNPVPPRAPKRTPRPQENAVIADSGERRKTRRSS